MPLICPPVAGGGRLSSLDRHFPLHGFSGEHPSQVIGLELRIAFAAIGATNIRAGDNDFWLSKCRELFLRPAAEPLLLAHWNKLKSFEMTEAQVANLCSMLCGTRQGPRMRDSYGRWDEANVRFETPEVARSWLDDIRAVANNPELNAILPAYAFARTIMAHPYPDGNGRLARALVHASLARTAGMPAPLLPLAPAFYMNAANLAAALRHLSANGDWEGFASVFGTVLAQASLLSKRIGSSLPS